MNPSDRTKESLLNKTENLCNAIIDIRNPDPWGGSGYLSTILRLAKLADASAYSNVEALEPGIDYATSAGRELGIREQAAGVVCVDFSDVCGLFDLDWFWGARQKRDHVLLATIGWSG